MNYLYRLICRSRLCRIEKLRQRKNNEERDNGRRVFEGSLFISGFETARENSKRDGKETVFRINRLASIKAERHEVRRRRDGKRRHRNSSCIIHATYDNMSPLVAFLVLWILLVSLVRPFGCSWKLSCTFFRCFESGQTKSFFCSWT